MSESSITLNDPRTVNAWCMYDWANSVYSLVITTAVFPIFYQVYTVEHFGSDEILFFGIPVINSVLYSYALSFSFLITAIILPFLSGIADYRGNKKFFMKIFVYMGSVSCICLYFFDGSNVELGIACSVLASIGFSGSLVFYDAFLPEISSFDQMDRISARGYSMGYIGSVILLVANIVMINFYESFGFGSVKDAMQVGFLLVGLWWLGFSQIPFNVLPERTTSATLSKGNLFKHGYLELIKVAKSLIRQNNMRLFLGSFFFFNMGVQTIILLSTTFAAKVLDMDQSSLIMTILIIQIVAVGGATLFARVSSRLGNKHTLLIMIMIWTLCSFAAYFVSNELQFYALAFFVGLVLGGIQSLARATYSKMIPSSTTDHASYFSFYDITYYISVVLGTFSYGLVEQLTGDIRQSALVLALYFVIGFVLMAFLKFDFKRERKQGTE